MAQEEGPNRGDQSRGPSSPRSPEPPQRSPVTPSQRPRPRFRWWWIAFALALLAVNYWVGTRATDKEPRLSVPYSPFFLEQVREGNVAKITSEGTTIQGTFERPERYGDSEPATEFETEIPAFADTDALSRSLESAEVVVNAEPLDTGPPWWQALLVSFGPTLLLVGLFVSSCAARAARRVR